MYKTNYIISHNIRKQFICLQWLIYTCIKLTLLTLWVGFAEVSSIKTPVQTGLFRSSWAILSRTIYTFIFLLRRVLTDPIRTMEKEKEMFQLLRLNRVTLPFTSWRSCHLINTKTTKNFLMEKIKGKIRLLSLIKLLHSLHQLQIHQVCANLHLKAGTHLMVAQEWCKPQWFPEQVKEALREALKSRWCNWSSAQHRGTFFFFPFPTDASESLFEVQFPTATEGSTWSSSGSGFGVHL